jgi:hypothetical protein
VKQLNLLAKFVLEVAALAAFGYWGASVADGVAAFVYAIVLPIAAAILWGLFAAPKARRRLPPIARLPFELGIFGLAALALWEAGAHAVALAFGVTVVLNAVLLTALDQWEA